MSTVAVAIRPGELACCRFALKIVVASDAVLRLLSLLAWDTDPAVEVLEAA